MTTKMNRPRASMRRRTFTRTTEATIGKDVPNSPRANDLGIPPHELVRDAMKRWLLYA
jgi:hypothetical protein